MVAVGAQYMLFFDLVNCSITESRNTETGNITYNATLEVEVSKINTSNTATEFSTKSIGFLLDFFLVATLVVPLIQ
ncbi:MAG: hypothetical protein HC912_05765, partial [Saprospiraceae bacterium]|nr:hypothetical protein [Saprospiraceae bacterium]